MISSEKLNGIRQFEFGWDISLRAQRRFLRASQNILINQDEEEETITELAWSSTLLSAVRRSLEGDEIAEPSIFIFWCLKSSNFLLPLDSHFIIASERKFRVKIEMIIKNRLRWMIERPSSENWKRWSFRSLFQVSNNSSVNSSCNWKIFPESWKLPRGLKRETGRLSDVCRKQGPRILRSIHKETIRGRAIILIFYSSNKLWLHDSKGPDISEQFFPSLSIFSGHHVIISCG